MLTTLAEGCFTCTHGLPLATDIQHLTISALTLYNPPMMQIQKPVDENTPLAVNRANAFETWLTMPLSKRAQLVQQQSPRGVLEAITSMQVMTDEGDVITPLEQIILNLVNMALEGNQSAINKVYNELQHEGVTKVQLNHTNDIDPVAREILANSGIIIDVDPDMVEVED